MTLFSLLFLIGCAKYGFNIIDQINYYVLGVHTNCLLYYKHTPPVCNLVCRLLCVCTERDVAKLVMWFCKAQVDLKKLLRNPPLVHVPEAEETLKNQPLIGALPDAVQRSLLESAKEFMKLRDSALYKEEVRPDGIWIIANGVVKVFLELGYVSPLYIDKRVTKTCRSSYF